MEKAETVTRVNDLVNPPQTLPSQADRSGLRHGDPRAGDPENRWSRLTSADLADALAAACHDVSDVDFDAWQSALRHWRNRSKFYTSWWNETCVRELQIASELLYAARRASPVGTDG